jgi:hypothetical protein
VSFLACPARFERATYALEALKMRLNNSLNNGIEVLAFGVASTPRSVGLSGMSWILGGIDRWLDGSASNLSGKPTFSSVLLNDACSLISDLIKVDRKICRFTRQTGINYSENLKYRVPFNEYLTYSLSNPWLVNLRVLLFSVTVLITLSGTPLGKDALISRVTFTSDPIRATR